MPGKQVARYHQFTILIRCDGQESTLIDVETLPGSEVQATIGNKSTNTSPTSIVFLCNSRVQSSR